MTDERRKEIEKDCERLELALASWEGETLAAHCRELLAENERLKAEAAALREALEAYKEATGIVQDVAYCDSLNRALRKSEVENAELRELVRQLSERCHAQSELLSRRAEGGAK